MLVLSRREGESIIIGEVISVKVISIDGSHVRLGIEAPLQTPVHREEVQKRIDEEEE